MPTCSVKIVGVIEHGRYLKRMVSALAALPAVRRAIKPNDIVYASGPDMALLCLVSGIGLKRPVILEVGDIRELQTTGGLKGRLIRWAEKHLVDACHLLIATARGFVDDYYRQWVRTTTPALTIENKLEPPDLAEQNRIRRTPRAKGTPLVDRPLRIGYFGLLRWVSSWEILTSLASERPNDVEIVVAGYPIAPINLPQLAADYPNIIYLGEYRSPDDLCSLYYAVDLVWAVYPDVDHWNYRWARTNRFYESCFYQTPIVSRSGCRDAIEIRRHDIGLTITDIETDMIVQRLSRIEPDDLVRWRTNIAKLPSETYLYTTEAEQLREALRVVTGPFIRRAN